MNHHIFLASVAETSKGSGEHDRMKRLRSNRRGGWCAAPRRTVVVAGRAARLSLLRLEPLESRTVPSRAFGFAFPSWWFSEYASAASDQSLQQMVDSANPDVIEIVPTWYMDTATSDAILADAQKTATDAGVRHVIQEAHARGLDVVLKPHVDVKDGSWRGGIAPADPTAWFASYTAFINHYAQVAEEEGVETLVVGTELKSMSGTAYEANWDGVINTVEASYDGRLTYAANHDEYATVSFWDRMDVIGIDAYFDFSGALPDPQPTHDQLVAAWQPFVTQIATWRAGAGLTQPVMFPEIGYRAIQDAQVRPWESWRAGTYDALTQRHCYDAAMEVWPVSAGWRSAPTARTCMSRANPTKA
jgi:hypothetical protein